MTVICLEGPLAVGKTSTCNALAAQYDAFVVPEMNRLFRPASWGSPDATDRRSFGEYVAAQPAGWYLDRQVERMTLALTAAQETPQLAVLDRDPFQPLWYEWAFAASEAAQTWADYRLRVAEGSLRFPQGYVVLCAEESMLRQRKESDGTRDRRGFEKMLRFIGPQKRYFAVMNRFAPGMVRFMTANRVAENVTQITEALPCFRSVAQTLDHLALFDRLAHWIAAHPIDPLESSRCP